MESHILSSGVLQIIQGQNWSKLSSKALFAIITHFHNMFVLLRMDCAGIFLLWEMSRNVFFGNCYKEQNKHYPLGIITAFIFKWKMNFDRFDMFFCPWSWIFVRIFSRKMYFHKAFLTFICWKDKNIFPKWCQTRPKMLHLSIE